MNKDKDKLNESSSSEDIISLENDKEQCSIEVSLLPDEILEFMLTYLPPYKDLENCSLVCRRWNDIVKNLIRRSKMNLLKGLLDFRLQWEVFNQYTAASLDTTSAQPAQSSSSLPMIAGRFSHSAVRHGNFMYIFGGGSSSDTTFNDLWRFDLSLLRWERPLSMGQYPSPKGSASMVCWNDQLILFGGWRYPSLHPPYQPWCLFDELHFYDLSTQRWTLKLTMPSPPSMAGHSASVHGDRMIVFGGYQISDGMNSNSNETWCLDLREQKWWQPRIAGNIKPPPRYGQFQLELDDEHMLIVGGCGGANSVYSDAWLLDMTKDVWQWRSIPVRNKKFAASHMWCNPACKVDTKLVVLGPTPNMPQDFQLIKQSRVPVSGDMNNQRLGAAMPNDRNNIIDRQRVAGGGDGNPIGAGVIRLHGNNNRHDHLRLIGANGVPDDQYYANRRAILNQHQQNPNNNILNNLNGNNINNNQLQPRTGRLRDLHVPAVPSVAIGLGPGEERNQNRPSSSTTPRLNGVVRNDNEISNNASPGTNDAEAANRLQRNLALRCRDRFNEPLLPKRFDEMYEDRFRMAAFNVQNRTRSLSRDHSERIRRMEEKMNAIRNSRRNAALIESKSIKEPSPKRVKRNVLSLFVCELATALDNTDPHIKWVEYKNYGILPGAPERLILSTMILGNGELILFGGVHKETLSEITHQVSNSVHFLSAPRDIV